MRMDEKNNIFVNIHDIIVCTHCKPRMNLYIFTLVFFLTLLCTPSIHFKINQVFYYVIFIAN